MDVIPTNLNESQSKYESKLIRNTFVGSEFRRIQYISDIHLDNKILKRFPKGCTDSEVKDYINSIVKKMYPEDESYFDFLIIAGDISHSKTICELFLTQLKTHYREWNIVYVLGNHELWGTYGDNLSLQQIQSDYCDMCRRNKIVMLEDSLLVFKNGKHILFGYENLKEADDHELREFLIGSSLIILGGTGFAANNKEFNAEHRIYRSTIGRVEEIAQSKRFDELHERISTIASDLNVIVLTHMPKTDWSSEDYVPNWVYVNGHTHRNKVLLDGNVRVYSDNQIGYLGKSIFIKFFLMGTTYDIFRDYEDGIHHITREQYVEYYQGHNIQMSMHRQGELMMLKRADLYLFLFRTGEGKLMTLEGGRIVKAGHPVEYYYEHMEDYANAVRSVLRGYEEKIRELSDMVKRIGGSGNNHGCIVDIDDYNHLYLNPLDGKVTPYYAENMVEKHVFDSVPSLLMTHAPHLLERAKETGTLPMEWTNKPNTRSQLYESTDIYRYSRIILSYQYCTENHLIRRWNDDILKRRRTNSLDLKKEGWVGLLEEAGLL